MCDEPHPLLIKQMIDHCVAGNLSEAYQIINHLWKLGYSPEDIIGIVFRVTKTHDMNEYLKLEFIKVGMELKLSGQADKIGLKMGRSQIRTWMVILKNSLLDAPCTHSLFTTAN